MGLFVSQIISPSISLTASKICHLIDEDDNYLVELAIAGNAGILVTHNVQDFNRSQLKFPQLQIGVATANDFVNFAL
ncbi:MAG: hypothetical protein ACRC2S_12855 [Waterburya sp.]